VAEKLCFERGLTTGGIGPHQVTYEAVAWPIHI